jgi:hypothetical protein
LAHPRKSSRTDEEFDKPTRSGLPAPYSGRVGGNKYVIYAYTQKELEDHPRLLVLNFKAAYAARRMIDLLVGKDGYEHYIIGGKSGIITTSGIKITAFGGQVEELLKYELSPQEAEWRDQQMEMSVGRLKFGTSWEGEPRVKEMEAQVEDEETGEIKTIKVKVPKEKKAKKEPKAKIDKSGMVTAGELAEGLKLEARIFRGALRALGLPKPEGGWLWPKAEADEIVKKVEKQLKGEKKKK